MKFFVLQTTLSTVHANGIAFVIQWLSGILIR